MVAQSPPFALQNAQHSAALFRQAAYSPWQRSGALASGELAVTAQSTPNMSVQVAGGRAWIAGTQVGSVSGQAFSTQAAYFGLNDAPVTLTISAADPTNPRIDLVVAAVQDSFYSGAANALTLSVVTGIPAASPAAPTAPSNALTLATVAVAANATSIGSSNIAQASVAALLAAVRGGQQVCTSTTRPSSPAAGTMIYETDTGATGYFDAAANSGAGRWLLWDSRPQMFTPAWQAGVPVPGTGGYNVGWYYRAGKQLKVHTDFAFGTGGSVGSGSYRPKLPTVDGAAATPVQGSYVASQTVYGPGGMGYANQYVGAGICYSGSTAAQTWALTVLVDPALGCFRPLILGNSTSGSFTEMGSGAPTPSGTFAGFGMEATFQYVA